VVCSVRSLGSSRISPSATKTFKAALRSCGTSGRDRQRNRGLFSRTLRGVSKPPEGSQILSFLFGPRLVCSSLLHLRSSWKVNCASYFALSAFSEVLHRSGPMRQCFLCGIGDWKVCVHTFSAKSAPNSQKCCGKQEICRKRAPRASIFIANSSLLGNKAGMSE
jgi:hypothetical protein